MKLLKLSFTLILGLMIFGQASAQELIEDDKFVQAKSINEVSVPSGNDASLNKAFYEGWKTPISAISSAGGNFQSYVGFLYEDSIVQYVSNQATFFQGWHVVGGVLDPTDANYELEGDAIKLSRFNAYTVDSLFLPYLYVRYVDSFDFGAGMQKVVDTLILKFYDYEELNYWNYQRDGATNIFAMPTNFTRSELGSANSTWEIKIPLTDADSTGVSDQGWFTDAMNIDLDVAIPDDPTLETQRRSVCGFSIAFKTALPFSFGDTLIARDGIEPTKKLNYFGYSFYANEGSYVPQTEAYNNSFWTNSDFLYGGEFSGISGYIPSNLWNTPRYLTYSMKINTNTLSVEKVNENMAVALYPNPVSRYETLKLDFNLLNADNVVIEMYDLLGNKVKEVANGYYVAGEHQVDLDISDLTPGVYVYSVTAGNAVSSKKITVTE